MKSDSDMVQRLLELTEVLEAVVVDNTLLATRDLDQRTRPKIGDE